MNRSTEFLVMNRLLFRLHETLLKKVCEQYRLTMLEATIISFLHNNPSKDTAQDIVELRMLSKGSVSQAVESLIQKELLRREQDQEDRRKNHLSLLPEAKPIIRMAEDTQQQFWEDIFQGVSPQEIEQFVKLNNRIKLNLQNALVRREQE